MTVNRSEQDPPAERSIIICGISQWVNRCPGLCDHCRPDELHPCALAPGHEGWHSCQT